MSKKVKVIDLGIINSRSAELEDSFRESCRLEELSLQGKTFQDVDAHFREAFDLEADVSIMGVGIDEMKALNVKRRALIDINKLTIMFEDGKVVSEEELEVFRNAEKRLATEVCKALGIDDLEDLYKEGEL